MGWSSATEIFDAVVDGILSTKATDIEKKVVIKILIRELLSKDWDCESESDFFNHPLVKECFIEIDKRYVEYYEEGEGN